MYSYSTDSTPALTRRQFTAHVTGVKPIRKEFGESVDYLLQTAWFRSFDATGQPTMQVLMKEPLPLSRGKSAYHEFTAATQFSRQSERWATMASFSTTCVSI
eukprot:4087577-Pyramimonas_sp.AAC.1